MSIFSDVNMYINVYSNADQVYDEHAINQSITTILGTVPGQRLFRPGFGCNLYNQLFEPMNTVTASSIRNQIMVAIEKWEPRVILISTEVIPDYANQQYSVHLAYRIPALEDKFSEFVFSLSKLPG